jgi:type I restriction enzyme M protein
MLQSNSKLKSLINDLWNTFWSGGIANPLTAIEQITYLIFMKRLDDLEAKRERDAEFTKEPYKSRFDGTYIPHVDDAFANISHDEEALDGPQRREVYRELSKPRPKQELRWSQFKRITPTEKMLEHVRFNVFPFIKSLNGDSSPFTKSMANAVFIIEKPTLLFEAINKIEAIFLEIEKDAKEGGQAFQDIQGDVYEMLLSEIATAGKNGQFRTPRHIIKLMAELVEPKLGDRIADPACGTGGFLLGAYKYILTELVRKQDPKNLVKDEDGFERGTTSAVLTPDVIQILSDSFYGFDIDTTMVRLGLMNLMMHGIDTPHIDYKDTLSKSFNEDSQYNIIMANPPFTGNIDKGDINENLKLPTTKTELLFVERIFTMLRTGGTAAIIVPQGVLFGSGKAFTMARKKLVEECELKAVISMPSGVFKPYAGVSTSILIFTKSSETVNTWFYNMESDGYSLDDKRTKKEGNGDLQDIVLRYKNRNPKTENDRKAKSFFVPKAELVENEYDLSINKYNEVVYDEIEYKDPLIIFASLEEIETNINSGLAELKAMIY